MVAKLSLPQFRAYQEVIRASEMQHGMGWGSAFPGMFSGSGEPARRHAPPPRYLDQKEERDRTEDFTRALHERIKETGRSTFSYQEIAERM